MSTKSAVWYVPAAEYACVVVPVVVAPTAPSPNAQKRFTAQFVDVSVNVAACPALRAGRGHRVGRDGAGDETFGSAVMTIANGSPDALLMTEAKTRTGWSLVNSTQRFVSVVPATPGNVPPSSRRLLHEPVRADGDRAARELASRRPSGSSR